MYVHFVENNYVYIYIYVNNYIYVALKTYHTSTLPIGCPVSVKESTIPSCLVTPVQEIISLGEQIGVLDAEKVRTRYTALTYTLLRELHQIKIHEVNQTMTLLSAMAFIPIVTEKNDGISLWPCPIVREKSNNILAVS